MSFWVTAYSTKDTNKAVKPTKFTFLDISGLMRNTPSLFYSNKFFSIGPFELAFVPLLPPTAEPTSSSASRSQIFNQNSPAITSDTTVQAASITNEILRNPLSYHYHHKESQFSVPLSNNSLTP